MNAHCGLNDRHCNMHQYPAVRVLSVMLPLPTLGCNSITIADAQMYDETGLLYLKQLVEFVCKLQQLPELAVLQLISHITG